MCRTYIRTTFLKQSIILYENRVAFPHNACLLRVELNPVAEVQVNRLAVLAPTVFGALPWIHCYRVRDNF